MLIFLVVPVLKATGTLEAATLTQASIPFGTG